MMTACDDKLRDTMYEAYERSVTLRELLDTAEPEARELRVARDDLERIALILPLISGFCLAALPTARTVQRLEAIATADFDQCATMLALVLDQIDYMHGACAINDAIGQVLPPETLIKARATLSGGR